MRISAISIILLLLLSTTVVAEVTESTLDSLWIRATSGEIRFRDEVQPAKDALVEKASEAVNFLTEKMDTRSAREMHALVDMLGKIGNVATAEVCGQLESDDDFRVRLACRTLGRIEDSSAVECLLPHATDTRFNIRSGVATALGEIGHHSATQVLNNLAGDEDYIVRKSATVALGKMPFDPAVQRLLDNLADDYYGVRYSAASALVGYEKKAVAFIEEFISDNLKTESTELSGARLFALALAVDCLGKIGDRRCSKKLKKIVRADHDPLIRAYAARALGDIGGKSNRKFLIKTQKSEIDPFVNSMISDGILRSNSE